MEIKDTIVSTFDLSGFFFSLPLNFASQEATNFWFDGQIFKFCRCPMGAKNSSVFATMAGQLIFSEYHLKLWATKQNITLGSSDFPFKHPRDFLKSYIDDIVCFSKQSLGKMMHVRILNFLLFCISTSNVRLAKKNAKYFAKSLSI